MAFLLPPYSGHSAVMPLENWANVIFIISCDTLDFNSIQIHSYDSAASNFVCFSPDL